MIIKLYADKQQQDTEYCAAWWQECKPPRTNSVIHFDNCTFKSCPLSVLTRDLLSNPERF